MSLHATAEDAAITRQAKNGRTMRGFTLVELAIVMTIIGLLIGGILKGQELMQNARATATIAQLRSYQSATTTFRDLYDQWPGDMATAQSRLPNCNAAHFCSNGNGDSIVGVPGTGSGAIQAGVTTAPQLETSMFWKHLAMADLISGIEPDADPLSPRWGGTHPVSRFNGGFEVFHDEGSYGLKVRLQPMLTPGISPLMANNTHSISPKYAYQIDMKIDDGVAHRGVVFGIPRVGADDGMACALTTGVYLVRLSRASCILHMRLY